MKKVHRHFRQSKPYVKKVEIWLAVSVCAGWNARHAGISEILLLAWHLPYWSGTRSAESLSAGFENDTAILAGHCT